MIKIGIIGIGFVGGAIRYSALLNGYEEGINLFCFDKYKEGFNVFDKILNSDIIFLSLPTKYSLEKGEYDKSAILEICSRLQNNDYKGLIVLKSTVEPKTTESLAANYELNIVHNPEFLTARNANNDYHNQKLSPIGITDMCDKSLIEKLLEYYRVNYPNCKTFIYKSDETELMKIFENSFCASKVQLFTELFLFCDKLNIKYDNVVNLIIKNGKISSNHTKVPGPDGKISYGGLCFPKDTNALCKMMIKQKSPCQVLQSTIEERNAMRDDNDNIN